MPSPWLVSNRNIVLIQGIVGPRGGSSLPCGTSVSFYLSGITSLFSPHRLRYSSCVLTTIQRAILLLRLVSCREPADHSTGVNISVKPATTGYEPGGWFRLYSDNGCDLDNPADAYVAVGTTPSLDQAGLWSLVLLSADIPTITEHGAGGYVVMVAPSRLARAEWELGHFEEENRNWPPQKILAIQASEIEKRPPTVLLMGALVIFYMITGPFSAGSHWFRLGAVNSRTILAGDEWWRLVTALTLHADPVHLLGNIFFGGVIVHFLCKMTGTGRGWFLLMLAGTIANLANVVARGPGHISVGFSTAIFGAVGLLCGGQIKLLSLRAVLLPLGAGVALLGMIGSSGERTDLGAHLWGLIVGLLLGLIWGWLDDKLRIGLRLGKQDYLLPVTILLVWFAWHKALAV